MLLAGVKIRYTEDRLAMWLNLIVPIVLVVGMACVPALPVAAPAAPATPRDGVTQGQARGADWRTTALWGLHDRTRFLHDGRARSVEAAILAHSGEAEPVVERFRALSTSERAALLTFLGSL